MPTLWGRIVASFIRCNFVPACAEIVPNAGARLIMLHKLEPYITALSNYAFRPATANVPSLRVSVFGKSTDWQIARSGRKAAFHQLQM